MEKPLLTKELQLDKNLKLSNTNFKQIILDSLHRTQNLKENLSRVEGSYPNDYVFVSLARQIYDEQTCNPDENFYLCRTLVDQKLGNWKLLTIAYNNAFRNGYVGAAYWNPDVQQIIISHRGTKPKDIKKILGALITDIKGIALNQRVPQVNSAVTFADKIVTVLKEIKGKENNGPYIHLFFTGHSLGGWLAQITTFTSKYVISDGKNFIKNPNFEETGYHASAVVFDSPGAKHRLERIRDSLADRYGLVLNSLDITCYFCAPNVVNACNPQSATGYKIFMHFSEQEKRWMQSNAVSYLLSTHSIDKFKEIFDPDTGRIREDENGEIKIHKVKDWPLLVSGDEEATIRDKIMGGVLLMAKLAVPSIIATVGEMIYCGSTKVKWYDEFMQELNNFFSVANESNDYHINVDDEEGHYRLIRYNTEPLDKNYKNEHSVNVFTQFEQEFLETFKLLEIHQAASPKEFKFKNVFNCLEKDKELKEKTMEMLKNYEIQNGIIKHSENLQKFIFHIKNLLYYFPEMKNEVEEAQKRLPFHIVNKFYETASSAYIKSAASILKFKKDIFKLNDSLGSEYQSCSLELENDIFKLSDFLSSNKAVLHAIQSCTSLGVAIAYRKFVSLQKDRKEWKGQIFLSLNSIFHLGSSLFVGFLKKVQTKYFFLLECNDLTCKKKTFLLDVLQIFKLKRNMKLVLVTQRNSDFNRFIREYVGQNISTCQENDVEVRVSDLTSTSQDSLLNIPITFQGKEVGLRTVISVNCNELDKIIDSETILELMKDERIKIGKALPGLGQIENYYINRKLVRKVKMKEKIFRISDLPNDLFLISNVDNDSLLNSVTVIEMSKFEVDSDKDSLPKVIIFESDNDEKAFTDFSKTYSQFNLHWLRNEGNAFIWQRSRSKNLSQYHKYIENDDDFSENANSACIEIINADDINKFNEKFIIIAAEPGMGKSTILTHIGTKSTGSKWFIRINLVEHELEQQDLLKVDDIISFLLENHNTYTVSDRLTKRIVQSCFEEGRCIILLDGFDEISETYQKTLINILEKLQNTNVERVFISTRLHLKDKLEDSLSTFAYTLKPFSRSDQEQFLKRFWQNDIDLEMSTETLEIYISELLKFISESIFDKERNFMGIPLQMQMVAEAFRKDLNNSLYAIQCLNSRPSFPEDFDVLKLYDCFIDAKYKVYFSKIGGEKIDLNTPSRKKMLTTRLAKLHGELAFYELFPNMDYEVQKNLIDEGPLSDSDKQELNLVGIYQFINGRLTFTHRTFAEYFVANFLAHKLNSKIENNHKYAVKFLSTELFEIKNEVIKTFLDYHLAKFQIHIATLKGQTTDLESVPNIKRTDVLGRSALHYAAQSGCKEIVQILLQKGLDVNSKDELGKTALHYAARYNNDMQVLVSLLEMTQDINVQDDNGHIPLYYAAQQGMWNIVEFLIMHGADSSVLDQTSLIFHYTHQNKPNLVDALVQQGVDIDSTDKHGNTLVHIAAQKGSSNIIDFLVKKGAKIDLLNNSGVKGICYAAENKHWDCVKLLIEHDDLNDLSDEQKDLFLHDSIEKNNWNIAKCFMKDENRNVYLTALNAQQRLELLCYTIQLKEIDVAEFLIEQGTNINLFNSQSKRPIHYAAESELWGMVQLLLRNNANFDDLDEKQTLSLLIHSAKCTDWDIVNLCKPRGDNTVYFQHLYGSLNDQQIASCLSYFVSIGRLDIVSFVIEELLNSSKINDIITPSSYGEMLLQVASQHESLNILEYFVNRIGDTMVRLNGHTAISFAVKKNHLQVAIFLVKKLADLDDTLPLHTAIKYGTEEIVEHYIETCIDINAQNNYGDTALHQAVIENKLDLVKCLVKHGANVDVSNNKNKKPIDIARDKGSGLIAQFLSEMNSYYEELLEAIRTGDLATVKCIMDCGYIDINAKFKSKYLLLHLAVGFGKFSVVKYFIEKGANTSLTDSFGNTALHWTAFNTKVDVLRFLLTSSETPSLSDKANVNIITLHSILTDKNETNKLETDLAYLCSYDDTDLDSTWQNDRLRMIKYLVDVKNIDFNLKNLGGYSVLHLMAQIGFVNALKYLIDVKSADIDLSDDNGTTILYLAANDDVVRYLVENGSNVNNKNIYGDTPLHWAVVHGTLDVVKCLVKNGSNVNNKNIYGDTPLHWAVVYGTLDVVKLLIEKGSCFDIQNNDGNTPLHLGAQENNFSVVKYFLDQNVDLFVTNNNGKTPKDLASEEDVIALLKKSESKRLINATKLGNFSELKELISRGVDIDEPDDLNVTPLYSAIQGGHLELVEYLIAEGANILEKNFHDTILHVAADSNKEILNLLLNKIREIQENTEDHINARDAEGDTPLLRTTRKENLSSARLLLEYGAGTDIKNYHGMTALHIAAEKGHLEIAELLIDKKADIHAMDISGRKPIHIAAQYGHENMIQFLLNKKVNVDDSDGNGWTPSHYAACNNNLKILDIFLAHGANINDEGKNGRFPLYLKFAAENYRNSVNHGMTHKYQTLHPNDLDSVYVDTFDIIAKCDILFSEGFKIYPQFLMHMHSIAVTFNNQGKYKEALQIFRWVFSLQKRPDVLGSSNPATLRTGMNVSVVLSKLGKYEEALDSLNEIYDIQKDVFGFDHCDTLNTYHNIAEVFYKQGKYNDALRIYDEVLEARVNLFHPLHPDVLITEFHKGRVINNKGNHFHAFEIFEKLYDLQKDILGEDHVDTLKTQHNKAFALYRRTKYDEANILVSDVLRKRSDVLGFNHPDTLTTRHLYALLCMERGLHDESLSVLTEICKIQKNILGIDHSDTLATLHDIAYTLFYLGQKQTAIELFRDVYEKRKTILGESHLYTSYTAEFLQSIELMSVTQNPTLEN